MIWLQIVIIRRQNSGYLWIFSNFIPACDGSTVNDCFDTKTNIKKMFRGCCVAFRYTFITIYTLGLYALFVLFVRLTSCSLPFIIGNVLLSILESKDILQKSYLLVVGALSGRYILNYSLLYLLLYLLLMS